MNSVYVALDVEATGLQAGTDEIIEVAAVRFRGAAVEDTFQRLVKPRYSLPIKIAQLTGIEQSELELAPSFHAVAPELARFIRTHPIVGHSVGFDLRMLAAQGLRIPQPSYDTFELATLLMPGRSSYSLAGLAAALEIPHPEAHRALADAQVARLLFLRLLDEIERLPIPALDEIVRLGKHTHWSLQPLFEAALRERARSALTLPLSGESDAEQSGVEWRQLKPLEPTGREEPLDLAVTSAFFAPDGPLRRSFPAYEPRKQQIDMTTAVARAFSEGDTLLVEAGTGTGKSLAYLVPAAQMATALGRRVVVSTNTINLQDQLFFKDIPDLQRVVDSSVIRGMPGEDAEPFTASLLKGRGNYLCLRRLHALRRSEHLTPEQARGLIKVGLWARDTKTGDRAELALGDEEARVWHDVNVTIDTCIGPRCPDFDRCFFYGARRAAEAAHLVVVNHALLLSDIKAEGKVLPPYDYLVIDEAHHLEDVATDQLGWSLDQAALLRFLEEIWTAGGARIVGGLLSELPNYWIGSAATPADADRAEGYAASIRPMVERVRVASYDWWGRVRGLVQQTSRDNSYEQRVRVTPALRASRGWSEIQQGWENMMLPLADIGKGLAKLEEFIRTLEHAGLPAYDELLVRLSALANFAVDTVIEGSKLVYGEDTTIHWLAYDRGRDELRLHAAPLHVGDVLRDKLWAEKDSVVLASATLTVDGSFDYVKDRLGLAAVPVDEVRLDSPFDYPASTLLYLPTDMPEPNDRAYQAALEQALLELATATGGRMLALFTSTAALRQTYKALEDPFEEREIVLLGQGLDGSRRAVLQRFRETPRAVLLGTSSFWEGVDIAGDALSVVAITKLPFAVPNDPVFAARSERFGDPFGDFAVPQAILKFKQGFGRLIRSREDRGVVAILDRRVLSKRYGRQFLDSLPAATVKQGLTKELPLAAARWLV
ncbi:MAG TPA: helicase C-terminal domain-containing protein [Herpetosiphonaceae bacterium]|nr:helicase C-terminal domain-containing protein [Herpetosiphonaceae bacterium]